MKGTLKGFFCRFINYRIILARLYYKPVEIEIDKIRCQRDFRFSNKLGYGGKRIEHFPPYKAFKNYCKKPRLAYENLKSFFLELIYDKKALLIPKNEGGWFEGSLFLLIKQELDKKKLPMTWSNIKKNGNIVKEAINDRINHYFALYDSISKNGYNPYQNPIKAEKKKGLFYLRDGHHRISILKSQNFIKVMIFKESIIFQIISKIKKVLEYQS